MPTVLVLDADQRSALAATRALGMAEYTVYTADTERKALAGRSKWSQRYFRYPDPSQDTKAALASIAQCCETHRVDLLMPMTDVSTHLVQNAQGSNLPKTPCPPEETYETASDKGALMRVAEQIGIAIPRTEEITPGTVLRALPDTFSFPVVMKPTRSRIPLENGYLHTQVAIAKDLDHLQRLQETHRWFRDHPWLLQSYIEGVGKGAFALYDNGAPLAWFAHQRVREKPPSGGVSVLSRSAALDQRLHDSASTLLNALQWHGPAMVEYRVSDDGTPYLMEINARFWGSLQLAISAGVNFPLLAAELALGRTPTPVKDYKVGVTNRWLLGDLDNLYLTLKGKEFSAGRKLLSAMRFLLPWWPGMRFEVLRLRDPRPFLHEFARYFGFGR
ncbi:MAG: ATP-grasp domain-containing protein [Pseudomonadota bacterium]